MSTVPVSSAQVLSRGWRPGDEGGVGHAAAEGLPNLLQGNHPIQHK